MSSFAAGFFRSLERNSQAQLDAQREQQRMEAMKKLDLKYQRNKKIEKRGDEWVEITTDGEGTEIPGLTRKLNEAEVARIRGDIAKSDVEIANAEDTLDPEYRGLAKRERLETLRFGDRERQMKEESHRNSMLTGQASRGLMGAQASAMSRKESSLEGKGWESASADTKIADIYNSLGREIDSTIKSKMPADPTTADETQLEMARVYKTNMDSVLRNIVNTSKSREEALGKIRRYLTTGTID